jgi:hypothetical protein
MIQGLAAVDTKERIAQMASAPTIEAQTAALRLRVLPIQLRIRREPASMLVEEVRDGCDYDLTEISRGEAEQIAAGRGAAALGRLGLSGVRATWTEPITRTWPGGCTAC